MYSSLEARRNRQFGQLMLRGQGQSWPMCLCQNLRFEIRWRSTLALSSALF